MAEMVDFLMHYYGFSADTAREVLAELRDTTSLQSLAGGYRAARAVPSFTAQIFKGDTVR
jgi:hypothetical protein